MTDIDSHEILSALLDREPVDADRLAALLERPESRALLVDFVRLRTVLHVDGTDAASIPAPVAARRRTIARPLLGVAAAVLLVVGGAFVGGRFGAADGEAPPEPTRVIQLVPAPATAGGAR